MVRPQLPLNTGDTVRFLRGGRWRFAIVTKTGRKWVHVRLDGRVLKVPSDNAYLWKAKQ